MLYLKFTFFFAVFDSPKPSNRPTLGLLFALGQDVIFVVSGACRLPRWVLRTSYWEVEAEINFHKFRWADGGDMWLWSWRRAFFRAWKRGGSVVAAAHTKPWKPCLNMGSWWRDRKLERSTFGNGGSQKQQADIDSWMKNYSILMAMQPPSPKKPSSLHSEFFLLYGSFNTTFSLKGHECTAKNPRKRPRGKKPLWNTG